MKLTLSSSSSSSTSSASSSSSSSSASSSSSWTPLSNSYAKLVLAIGIQMASLAPQALAAPDSALHAPSHLHTKLINRCCEVGRERAQESPKFACKLAARDAFLGSPSRRLLALAAESALARDPNFADQCELVLESCCMAHHRTRNCDSGKQFAKSGTACMDVELSKEATVATESFNDCCMSCSLGILAARNAANETTATSQGAHRCRLLSSLASSLSGQLYEQTYVECCQENLPRVSSALVEPGAPIDCAQSNPCAHRCVTAPGSRLADSAPDKCECFAGYRLAADGVNCVDVDECKLDTHSCNRHSELCDNTPGGFRCLARARHLAGFGETAASEAASGGADLEPPEFASMRLCAAGTRWLADEARCSSPKAPRSAASFSSQQSSSSHSRSSRSSSSSASHSSRLVAAG